MRIPTYSDGKPTNLQAAILDAEYWLRCLRSCLNDDPGLSASKWSEHLAGLRRAIRALEKFLPDEPVTSANRTKVTGGIAARAPGRSKEEVYNYITNYLERVGHSPTLAEIADAVGLKPPTVHYHLESLEIEERIERRPGSPRGITVL